MTTETIENIEIGGILPTTLVRGLVEALVDDGVEASSVDVVLGRKLEISVLGDLDDGFAATEYFCRAYGLTFRQETVYYDGSIVQVTVWEPGMDQPGFYHYLYESIVVPIDDNAPEHVERVRYLDRLVVPPLTYAEHAVGLGEPGAPVGFV